MSNKDADEEGERSALREASLRTVAKFTDGEEESQAVVTKPAASKDDLAQSGKLVAWLSALFFSAIGENVLRKKVLIHAPNYAILFAQLSPVIGVIVFGLLMFRIPAENRDFRPKDGILIGVCFSLFQILQNLGARGDAISGPFILLTQKLLTVFSMLIATSILLLSRIRTPAQGLLENVAGGIQTQFDKWQWLACVLLIVGIIPTFIFELQHDDTKFNMGQFLLLLVSIVPLALGFVHVELLLRTRYPRLNVLTLWFWVVVVQTVFSIPLGSLMIGVVGEADDTFWQNTLDGMQCVFFGRDARPNDQCSGVLLVYAFAAVAGIVMNIAMPAATRLGGAARMWLVRALTLPAASLFFTVEFIMGEGMTTKLTSEDIMGLFLVLGAMCLYEHKTAVDPVIHWARSKCGRGYVNLDAANGQV